MTDGTFWDPKLPHIPIGKFWGTIRNLGNYHLLDTITKEKPAKFQIKRTAGSKV